MNRVYHEIIDFIAGDPSARQMARFKASPAIRHRVAGLLHRQKSGSLSDQEAAALNHYLELEHIIRLAKARARQHVDRR